VSPIFHAKNPKKKTGGNALSTNQENCEYNGIVEEGQKKKKPVAMPSAPFRRIVGTMGT